MSSRYICRLLMITKRPDVEAMRFHLGNGDVGAVVLLRLGPRNLRDTSLAWCIVSTSETLAD